jgi:hypothetical protein
MRWEVLPPLRQRCYRLCPMRPGHAQDNCRHVESHPPAVGIFPGDRWTIPKNRGRRSDDVMTAPLSPLPASAAQYIDTRRTDAGGRNRRADPDYSEMRPRSWLPIRCPNRARPRQPAHSSRSVCSADQPASFDAIVFPPHGLPANVRSRSEQRPNGIRSASYHRPDAVRSAYRPLIGGWRLPHTAGAVIRLPRGNGRHTPVRFHSPLVDWSRILPAGGVAATCCAASHESG